MPILIASHLPTAIQTPKATMSAQTVFETYPFIAPEKYAGKLTGKIVSTIKHDKISKQTSHTDHSRQAIVTGTSSGIGRAIAKAFAAAGASVACIARREPELQSLVEEITSQGSHAVAIAADITAPGAAQTILTKTEAAFGRADVDILINNAGISRISPLAAEPADLDLWWRVYEVNVRAPVTLARAVLPGMVARGSGVVLSVSSGVASMGLPVMTAYASSKAGISKFHESLSYELQGTGVLSFAMCPGMVATDLGAPAEAINKEKGAMEHPATKAFLSALAGGVQRGTPELPADMAVAAVADERFKVLNGRHFYAGEPVEPLLEELEKPAGGRIGKERLYFVNIGQLN